MKKFFSYKLFFLCFGAVFLAPNAGAVDAFELYEQRLAKEADPGYIPEIDRPRCFSSTHRVDLKQPKLGEEAVLLKKCESLHAAEYLVTAIQEGNSLKKAKALKVCRGGVDIGVVQVITETTAIPVTDDQQTMYVSAVKIVEELYGEELFGIAVGCGAETPEHKRLRQVEEQAQANRLARLVSQKKVGSALDSMTTKITKAWRRPSGFSGGLEVYMRMTLEPSGELKKVTILKASSDDSFDRSALAAVKKAAPFDEINSFDAETFDEEFRSLTVKFRPED